MMGCSDLLGVRVRGGRGSSILRIVPYWLGFFHSTYGLQNVMILYIGGVCVCMFTVAEMHVYWRG